MEDRTSRDSSSEPPVRARTSSLSLSSQFNNVDDIPEESVTTTPYSASRYYPLTSSTAAERESRSSRMSPGAKEILGHNSHSWLLFQEAAANTSKLYQARASGQAGHWQNFQNTASAITMLYKEGLDLQQRSFESGVRAGVERAHGAVMDWLVQDPRVRSRKVLRTDDLISFMRSSRNPANYFPSKMRSNRSMERSFNAESGGTLDNQLGDLQTFRDALYVSSLNGAMSRVSVNRSPPRTVFPPSQSANSPSPSRARSVDLHAFITEEIRRHKRSNSLAFDLDELDQLDQLDHHDNLKPFKRARFTPPR